MAKRNRILFAVLILLLILAGAFLFYWLRNAAPFEPGEDETALRINMDTDEDVGLIVFDYEADGHKYSGGVSNADRSLIKHDDSIINVWNREDLGCEGDSISVTFEFRIITDYIDPNFENIYPEEITRRIDPLTLDMEFGKIYDITIRGSRDKGYRAVVGKE